MPTWPRVLNYCSTRHTKGKINYKIRKSETTDCEITYHATLTQKHNE